MWIDDLAVDRDPHAYDLCLRHSQRFVVPTGWRLEDRRDRFTMVIPNRLAGLLRHLGRRQALNQLRNARLFRFCFCGLVAIR